MWVPRVHLTPAQLAMAGLVAGAAIDGAAQAIARGGQNIDWAAVAAAAVTTGLAAWTQSHHHVDPDPDHSS